MLSRPRRREQALFCAFCLDWAVDGDTRLVSVPAGEQTTLFRHLRGVLESWSPAPLRSRAGRGLVSACWQSRPINPYCVSKVDTPRQNTPRGQQILLPWNTAAFHGVDAREREREEGRKERKRKREASEDPFCIAVTRFPGVPLFLVSPLADLVKTNSTTQQRIHWCNS